MKVTLIFILSVVSGVCHSQQWFLRVKPMIGTPIASFQRFDTVVYDPIINYSNGIKPSNISITDNVELRLQYNLELFADFYQINPNWKIGAGFGVYNGSRVFLKSQNIEQNSHLVWQDNIILGNAQNSKHVTSGPVDFNTYVMATRDLPFQLNEKKQINQFISFGVGFTKNKKSDITIDDPGWGLYVIESYKKHFFFPFLMFRYEFEFLTKSGKNLLNCSLTYQQGVFNVQKFTNYDIYNFGTYEYQQSKSRGSSIGVSISKPFYIKSPNQLTKDK
jgi:hypothetical protein